MEIKSNEATRNRPDGDRVLDAATVFLDIPAVIQQLRNEDAYHKSDRNSMTILKTELLTVVVICLHKGAVIEPTSIDGLATYLVWEGSIELFVNTGTQEMVKGQMAAIHKFMNHSITANEDSVIVLTNSILDTQTFS